MVVGKAIQAHNARDRSTNISGARIEGHVGGTKRTARPCNSGLSEQELNLTAHTKPITTRKKDHTTKMFTRKGLHAGVAPQRVTKREQPKPTFD